MSGLNSCTAPTARAGGQQQVELEAAGAGEMAPPGSRRAEKPCRNSRSAGRWPVAAATGMACSRPQLAGTPKRLRWLVAGPESRLRCPSRPVEGFPTQCC